jgi:hypothetical protein
MYLIYRTCKILPSKCNTFVTCWLEHYLIHVSIYIYISHVSAIWGHHQVYIMSRINCYTVVNVSCARKMCKPKSLVLSNPVGFLVKIILK